MSAVPSQISSRPEKPPESTEGIPDVGAPYSRKTYLVAKRCLDVILALIMLILSLPLWFLIAVLIKCDSRGPVLFVNRAIGQHGRDFLLYKFRSMHFVTRPQVEKVDVSKTVLERQPTTYRNGRPIYKTALANDSRITRVGRIIRRVSLDELPQLWNIFRGDLCFV